MRGPLYTARGKGRVVTCEPLVIASCNNTTSAGAVSTRFHVETPDVRCKYRISIHIDFAEDYTSNFIAGSAPTLWLVGEMMNWGPGSGINAGPLPLENLEGTRAAPTALPADSALRGYSKEFQGMWDRITGIFSVNVSVNRTFKFILEVKMQPGPGDGLSEAEWLEDVALFRGNTGLDTPKITLGAEF